MDAHATSQAIENSPIFIAPRAALKPCIASVPPRKTWAMRLPIAAVSIPAMAVVIVSSIGVISLNIPAANSLNLPPMTVILSLIVSKVLAFLSMMSGMVPSSPFAFAIAPSKSCRNASVRPPDLPKNSMDAAARSAGVGSSEMALASI